jgi:hypothetical protein
MRPCTIAAVRFDTESLSSITSTSEPTQEAPSVDVQPEDDLMLAVSVENFIEYYEKVLSTILGRRILSLETRTHSHYRCDATLMPRNRKIHNRSRAIIVRLKAI